MGGLIFSSTGFGHHAAARAARRSASGGRATCVHSGAGTGAGTDAMGRLHDEWAPECLGGPHMGDVALCRTKKEYRIEYPTLVRGTGAAHPAAHRHAHTRGRSPEFSARYSRPPSYVYCTVSKVVRSPLVSVTSGALWADCGGAVSPSPPNSNSGILTT